MASADDPPDSDAIPFGSSWRRWAARKARAVLVEDLELGARGKVEGGAMAIGRTMRAPISGRECVLWVVDNADVPYAQRDRRVSEASFFVCDANGQRLLVETTRTVVDVPRVRLLHEGRPVLEGIIAPGERVYAWGIASGTADVGFVEGYRMSTTVERRIRSTSVDRAVIGIP